MTPAEIHSGLLAAGSDLERICHWLESPTPPVLDNCAESFETVVKKLREYRPYFPAADRNVALEMRRLRATLARAGKLLQLAGAYHQRWREIHAGMTAGYTRCGIAAPVTGIRKFQLEG